MSVGLGVIGAGLFAQSFHVPALNELQSLFKVKAVYSRSLESAMRLKELLVMHQDVRVYYGDNLDGLLSDPEIEAVDICLPIDMQPQIIQKALQSGKNVISEKPVAPNCKMGEELIDEYEKKYSNLVWGIAENYCYEPYIIEAKNYVTSGKIGNVRIVNLAAFPNITNTSPYFHTTWRKNPNFVGGYLLDGGVHFVAALRYILGDIQMVSGFQSQFNNELPPADSLVSAFRLQNGALGTMTISFACTAIAAPFQEKAPPLITIMGDKGILTVSRDKLECVYESLEGQKAAECPQLDRKANLTAGVAEFKAFGEAVLRNKGNKDTPQHLPQHLPPIYTPREALKDVKAIQAIFQTSNQ